VAGWLAGWLLAWRRLHVLACSLAQPTRVADTCSLRGPPVQVGAQMGCSNEVLTVVSMLSVPSVFFRPPDRCARWHLCACHLCACNRSHAKHSPPPVRVQPSTYTRRPARPLPPATTSDQLPQG
jgi:hypothetical protein